MFSQTKIRKTLYLALLLCVNTAFLFSQDGAFRIEAEACIDGKRLLWKQDHKMWREHVGFDPPGTLNL